MKKIDALKQNVRANRALYSAGVTFALCLALHIRVTQNWNKFLDQHGLTNEYYHLDEVD